MFLLVKLFFLGMFHEFLKMKLKIYLVYHGRWSTREIKQFTLVVYHYIEPIQSVTTV